MTKQTQHLPLIKVDTKARRSLQDIFNVKHPTVSLALNGHRSNPKSLQIRHTALTQFGGVEMVPKLPIKE